MQVLLWSPCLTTEEMPIPLVDAYLFLFGEELEFGPRAHTC